MRYGRQSSPADANAPDLYANLRKLGWRVAPITAADKTAWGVPDSVCSRGGVGGGINHFLEVKTLGGYLQPNQVAFHSAWTGCVHVATSSFQADELMRECEKRLASALRPTVPSA